MFVLEHQRTAGAYRPVKHFITHEDAVAELAKIASKKPNRPYNGGDKWQDSSDVHNVNRYRITEVKEIY